MNILSEYSDRWYSIPLIVAGEKPLYGQKVQANELIIRFTWLRSFNRPVVIKAILSSDQSKIIGKRLNGRGEYPIGVVTKVDREMADNEIEKILSLIDKENIRKQPHGGCEIGFDGSQWIIELVDEKGYYFMDRWSPNKGPIYDVGIAMLELSGWTFKKIY